MYVVYNVDSHGIENVIAQDVPESRETVVCMNIVGCHNGYPIPIECVSL